MEPLHATPVPQFQKHKNLVLITGSLYPSCELTLGLNSPLSPSLRFEYHNQTYRYIPQFNHFFGQLSTSQPVSSRLTMNQPTHTDDSPMPDLANSSGNDHICELDNQSFDRSHPHLYSHFQESGITSIQALGQEQQYLEHPIQESIQESLSIGSRNERTGYPSFSYPPIPATPDVYPSIYSPSLSPEPHLETPSSSPLGYSERAQSIYSEQPTFEVEPEHTAAPLWTSYSQFDPANTQNSSPYSTEPLQLAHTEFESSFLAEVSLSQGTSSATGTVGWVASSGTTGRITVNDPEAQYSPLASTLKGNHGSSIHSSTARSSSTSPHKPEPVPSLTPAEAQAMYQPNEYSSLTPYNPPGLYSPQLGRAALPNGLNDTYVECDVCAQKTLSQDFAKHKQKHQKLHRCRVPNCSRTDGFTTTNDRDRHEKSVHKTPGTYFQCMEKNCSSYARIFARRDNLKDHLKRMHPTPEGMDEAEANELRNQLADQWKLELPQAGPAQSPPSTHGSFPPSPNVFRPA